jgi:uncharacterized membrane protein
VSRREWAAWIAAALATAMVVHLATLHALPRLIMARTLATIGPPNIMQFGKRPDETSRRVVRPSPDLLYAACRFDLSKGPLRVTAEVPHSTYWSISAFDAETDNFFVLNNRQIAGDKIEITALPPDMPPPSAVDASGTVTLASPTQTGLFLIRLLVDDERSLTALDRIRRGASCRTTGSD